jgi:hypothetical protein
VSRIQKTPRTTRFWFDEILDFANAANAADATAVAQQLSGGDGGVWLSQTDPARKTWQLRFPTEWEASNLHGEQRAMRKLLDEVVAEGVTRSLWEQLVMASMPAAPVTGMAIVMGDKPNTFFTLAAIEPRSVKQWYAMAIAELAAQGLGDNVRKCSLRSCGKYFVDTASRAYYCSESHASQDRVAAKRANKSVEAWRRRK